MTHIAFRDYFRNFCLLETNLSCNIFNRDHFEGFINNTSVCEKLDIFMFILNIIMHIKRDKHKYIK